MAVDPPVFQYPHASVLQEMAEPDLSRLDSPNVQIRVRLQPGTPHNSHHLARGVVQVNGPASPLSIIGGSPSDWPLVGRDPERALLSGVITEGRRAGLVLCGEPGVGKTRLALETMRDAQERGLRTIWLVATKSAMSIPFGPFASILPKLPASSVSRLDLLRQLAEALTTRASGCRLVVGVDDAHQLDDASAALVHQLALSRSAFVLVTLRAGEHAPDSIVALWKDELAERLELGTLSRDEVAKLVPAVLRGQVDGSTIARLWRATRGNALLLRELLLAGLHAGALTHAEGVWTWQGPMAMSQRLQEVVAARLGTLEPDQVALMELVAYGEPLSASILETLFSPSTLEAAERRGVVTVEALGRRMLVRLAHPLYAEVARTRCPTLRCRAVHRELARALEDTGARRSEDVLRLATFRLEAGEAGSPKILLAGARMAHAAFEVQLSERLARAAADAGGGVAAKLALAEAFLDQGRGVEAAALLSGVDERELSERERAMHAGLRGYATWMGLGRPEEAQEILVRAEQAVQHSSLRDGLTAVRAAVLCFSGKPQQAIAVVEGLERGGVDEQTSFRAANAVGFARAVVGQTDRFVAAAERWAEPARELAARLPFFPFQLKAVQSYALCLSGRLAEAGEVAEKAHHEAVALEAVKPAAMLAATRGLVAMCRGEVRDAVSWLREGAAGLREPSLLNLRSFCCALLVRACVLRGDLAGAASALAEARTAMSPAVSVFEPQLTLAGAWLAAGSGELSKAKALALAAAQQAQASGQHAIEVVALHDLARFGHPHPARLGQLAGLVDGPFAPACAMRASALAARDGTQLDQAAAMFAAMDANLLAAEVAAQAAAAHAAQGRKAPALASSARSRRWLDTCQGARSPVLAALTTPLLTPREHEVARLAAEGRSNGEIAECLVVSPRTVETHLQRAYAKLGVASRQELRALLDASAPDPLRP